MIFQRSANSFFDLADTIETARLTIRFPQIEDYSEWAQLRALSRDFLVPWEASWATNDLSRSSYAHRVRRYRDNARRDDAYPLFMFQSHDNKTLVGAITISNVRRGIAQTASMGYWIGKPYANNGYMSEGVRAVCNFCFDQLGLHRIEAACLLTNGASAKVLEKTGFTHEGMARQYLKINGKWQDHLLFGLLKDDR